jgi:hypothetical protein
MYAPTVKALPFAASAGGKRSESGWPATFWNDLPTADWRSDHDRGKEFAKLTLGAILADQCSRRPRARANFRVH